MYRTENAWFIASGTVLKVKEQFKILATEEVNGENTHGAIQLAVDHRRNLKTNLKSQGQNKFTDRERQKPHGIVSLVN